MNTSDSILETLVEVKLKNQDSFLKIREILTRIGIASNKNEQNTLYQSCHILHKKGKYYIVHFKEMLILDGKEDSTFNDNDIARRNLIACLLERWDHVAIENPDIVRNPIAKMEDIHIVKHSDKNNWKFVHKYHFNNTNQ